MALSSADARPGAAIRGSGAIANMSRSVDRAVHAMAVLATLIAAPAVGLHGDRVPLLLVALVPWVLAYCRVAVPPPLFAAVVLLPLLALSRVEECKTVLLLGVATAAWVGNRSASYVLNGFVVAAGAAGSVIAFNAGDEPAGNYLTSGSVVWLAAMLCGTLVGMMLRRNRGLAEDLIATQQQLVATAALDERRRIAQDVHDVVAHSLAVALLNITGARKVLTTDPQRADEALERAEEVGRSSLSGVRSVVGLLRGDDGGLAMGPLADARDVADLVDGFQRSGMAVDLAVDGELDDLDPAVGAVLFRMMRESLANVLHHAAGAAATAAVVVRPGTLEVTVSNPLPDRPSPGGSGLGLRGIAERVAALGGELRAGPHEGAWRVWAMIPLQPA